MKEFFRRADSNLLGGRAFGLWRTVAAAARARSLRKQHLREACLLYTPNRREFAELCDKYGSDKGSQKLAGRVYAGRPHDYADFYELLFGHSRLAIRNVFECGIGTNGTSFAYNMGPAGSPGASLRVWRDYFPSAQVMGADIDASILFQEERIRCFPLDQTSKDSIAAFWASCGVLDVDIIVDDGLHEFSAGVSLFEGSIDRLSPTGTYLIEDVSRADLLKYSRYFAGAPYNIYFVELSKPDDGRNDNNLVVVRKVSGESSGLRALVFR